MVCSNLLGDTAQALRADYPDATLRPKCARRCHLEGKQSSRRDDAGEHALSAEGRGCGGGGTSAGEVERGSGIFIGVQGRVLGAVCAGVLVGKGARRSAAYSPFVVGAPPAGARL